MPEWDEEMGKAAVTKAVKVMGLGMKELSLAALRLLKSLFTHEKLGQISMAQIEKKGGKLISTELKGTDLAELDKIAKRYQIAFSAMENPDQKSYTLFFKAESEHQMNAALKAYLARVIEKNKNPQEQKEPLHERVSRAEQQSQQQAEHAKERTRERVREKEHSR